MTLARYRELSLDFKQQLKFLSQIAATTLQQDFVFVSDSTTQAVLQELTVPCVDR